ncbi:MAG: hypothetical protein KDD75_10830, partial [Caldilineaceae bacterium]|nr:hypothetical protein [Caldilineaceae bacterium]
MKTAQTQSIITSPCRAVATTLRFRWLSAAAALLLAMFFLHGTAQAQSRSPSFCDSVTQVPKSQCLALVDLYNSTNGDGWHNNLGWFQSNQPCSWGGVGCFGPNIATIGIYSNTLAGP